MLMRNLLAMTLIMFLFSSTALGQGMEHFKKDVGDWDAEMRMFEPGVDKPQTSKGTEHNAMLGDLWIVSHFKGEMMGEPFEGASYTGYNPETKKYFGNWIDSMTPSPMKVEGTWDEDKQTMTSIGSGMGPDGAEMKMKMITTYPKDGSRLFTMFMAMPDDTEMKMMEIHYTRSKVQHDQGHAVPQSGGKQ